MELLQILGVVAAGVIAAITLTLGILLPIVATLGGRAWSVKAHVYVLLIISATLFIWQLNLYGWL